MCIPCAHLWTHGAHTLIGTLWDGQPFFTLCYFVLFKKAVIAAPVFSLARRCGSDRCCVFSSRHVYLHRHACACACKTEWSVWESLCMHIYLMQRTCIQCWTWLLCASVLEIRVWESPISQKGMLLMFSYQRLKGWRRHQFVVLCISFLFLSSLLSIWECFFLFFFNLLQLPLQMRLCFCSCLFVGWLVSYWRNFYEICLS